MNVAGMTKSKDRSRSTLEHAVLEDFEGLIAAVHICLLSGSDHDQPTAHHSRILDRY